MAVLGILRIYGEDLGYRNHILILDVLFQKIEKMPFSSKN